MARNNREMSVTTTTTSYIVSDKMARTIVWIGVAGYTVSALTYVLKLLLNSIDYTFENFVKYGLLIIGFTLLSISTIIKAVEVQKDRKDMEKPEFLFQKLTRMGWAFMTFHFITLYVLPHHTHIYYLIALAGYVLLTMGQKLGVYMNVTFYVLSSIFMFMRPVVDYAILPSKVLNMFYMGGYAYIFARQYWDRKKQEKEHIA